MYGMSITIRDQPVYLKFPNNYSHELLDKTTRNSTQKQGRGSQNRTKK